MLEASQKTIIPFFMAGYPTMGTCEAILNAVIREGVEVIEIGVPYSDPMADGPTIQNASAVALKNGTTLETVFQLTRRLKKTHPKVSLVLFTYFNPILKFGLDRYVKEAAAAGVSATLTVDLPPEEAVEYLKSHQQAGLKTVFLASPTTNPARLPLLSEASSAFIYYVSRAGVTGAQTALSNSLSQEIINLRRITSKPIAVGFGISSPAQALEVAKHADAVVIGSHFLNLIETSPDANSASQNVCSFIRTTFDTLKSGGF